MRAAVIDAEGAVVNVICADPSKNSVPGYTLVEVPEGLPVDSRWCWTEQDGFVPSPELQAELDQKAAAVEAEAFDMGE